MLCDIPELPPEFPKDNALDAKMPALIHEASRPLSEPLANPSTSSESHEELPANGEMVTKPKPPPTTSEDGALNALISSLEDLVTSLEVVPGPEDVSTASVTPCPMVASSSPDLSLLPPPPVTSGDNPPASCSLSEFSPLSSPQTVVQEPFPSELAMIFDNLRPSRADQAEVAKEHCEADDNIMIVNESSVSPRCPAPLSFQRLRYCPEYPVRWWNPSRSSLLLSFSPVSSPVRIVSPLSIPLFCSRVLSPLFIALQAPITGGKGTWKQVGTSQEHGRNWNTLPVM